MAEQLFTNTHIISWLQYFSENTDLDLEHVKLLDITKKNKNIILKIFLLNHQLNKIFHQNIKEDHLIQMLI